MIAFHLGVLMRAVDARTRCSASPPGPSEPTFDEPHCLDAHPEIGTPQVAFERAFVHASVT